MFDPVTAAVRQSGNWQCSAASVAWMLESIGRGETQDDVVAGLGPARIDPSVGLHDGSGAGLVDYLRSLGLSAGNGPVSFQDVADRAGHQPLAIGGQRWNHWTGVVGTDGDSLTLANPSPGWMGVGDRMSHGEFDLLGPMYGVWIDGLDAGAPDPVAAVTDAVSGGVTFAREHWWLLGGAVALFLLKR